MRQQTAHLQSKASRKQLEQQLRSEIVFWKSQFDNERSEHETTRAEVDSMQDDLVVMIEENVVPRQSINKFAEIQSLKQQVRNQTMFREILQKQLIAKTAKQGDHSKCCICLDKDVEVYNYPCGHCNLCGDCCRQMEDDTCPICREEVKAYLRVYL